MPIDVDRGYVPNLRDGEGNVLVAQPNAGVMTRFTPEGIAVHMYWGQPGVYWGDHGQELPESMARAARYPIDELSLQRRKREAMSAAQIAIEAEYSFTQKRKVVEQREEYALVDIGSGLFNIEFTDGTLMNPQPLAKDIAMRVFDQITPKPKPKPEPKPTPKEDPKDFHLPAVIEDKPAFKK